MAKITQMIRLKYRLIVCEGSLGIGGFDTKRVRIVIKKQQRLKVLHDPPLLP